MSNVDSCSFLRAVDVSRGLILAPTHGLCNIDFYLLSRNAWTAWICTPYVDFCSFLRAVGVPRGLALTPVD